MIFGEFDAFLSLIDRFKSWLQGNDRKSTLATRFIELFEKHGVHRNQIPRLLEHDLKLSDVRDNATLLAVLNDSQLDAACAMFGVRREWLDGVDSRLYELQYCYKEPRRFFAQLDLLKTPANIFPVRALSSRLQLDRHANTSQRIELIMLETIATIGEQEIYRFRPFSDGWNWGYPECRLQLKAIIRAYGKPVPLYEVSAEEIESIYSGEIVPGTLMHGSLLTSPSLEDYCMSKQESPQAKETEELDSVIEYLENNIRSHD